MKILVSKCLLGENCRYDGKNCKCDKLPAYLFGHEVISVCPEIAGGLATPRQPAERVGDKIIAKNGVDVSAEYRKGAQFALSLACQYNVDLCILKARSPSCGSNIIYDGTFTGGLTYGDGVTAELLKKNGFKVITEKDL